jgi:5-methyltetrahydrofolate--homocysteine methyltransferase
LIIIGEKINATRKKIKEALTHKDIDFLKELCTEQCGAGADYIDVNVGTGDEDAGDEASLMTWLVKELEEVSDKPFCIDSSSAEVIAAGVQACRTAVPMINSVNASEEKMQAIFPIVAQHKTPVVALPVTEDGIPAVARDRVQVCKTMLDRAAEFDISPDAFFFDPLVVPLSTGQSQGQTTLDTIALLKTTIKDAKTVIGVSNISFGLPRRSLINRAFLTLAIGAGVDAAILDPTDPGLISQLRAAEVVAGRDKRCRKYIRAHTDGRLVD